MKIELNQIIDKLESLYLSYDINAIQQIRTQLNELDKQTLKEDECSYADVLIAKLIVELFLLDKENIDKKFKQDCSHEIYEEISCYLNDFNYLTTQHIKNVFTNYTLLTFN